MSKITAVEPIVVSVTEKTRWIFVRITSADGLAGLGEATLSGQEAQVVACIHQLGRIVIDGGVDSINATTCAS